MTFRERIIGRCSSSYVRPVFRLRLKSGDRAEGKGGPFRERDGNCIAPDAPGKFRGSFP